MTDDRESFRVARIKAKAKAHEKRLENATYTAAEVKVLTEAALRLGRKEAGEEVAAAIEAFMEEMAASSVAVQLAYGSPHNYLLRTVEIARQIASQPSPDATSGRTDPAEPEGCTSVHPMASHIPCVMPVGHEGDHRSRNGRNWRPRENA